MKKMFGFIALALLLAGCTKESPGKPEDSVGSSGRSVVTDTTGQSTESESTSSSHETTTTSKEQATSASSGEAADPLVPLEQAVDFKQALAIFQDKYPDAVITDFQWEANGSFQGSRTKVYEIEGEDAKGEYEVTIDAVANKVHVESDLEDNSDWQAEQLPMTEIIPMEEAAKTAAKQVVGDTQLSKIELEEEEGAILWEVKFFRQRQWQSVTIDAKTGEFLSVAGTVENTTP